MNALEDHKGGADKPVLYVYIPKECADYVQRIVDEQDISKSEFITLLLSLANAKYTPAEIKHIYKQVQLFGIHKALESL